MKYDEFDYYGMNTTKGNKRVRDLVLDCLYNGYDYKNAKILLAKLSEFKSYSEAYNCSVREYVYKAMQPNSEQYNYIRFIKEDEMMSLKTK